MRASGRDIMRIMADIGCRSSRPMGPLDESDREERREEADIT